jgi:hypothetical protein
MDALIVVLIGAAIAAYLTAVWLSTKSRAILFWAIWAVVGSAVLLIAAILTAFCGIAENNSDLFRERCEGSIPYIPLYAIPLLLAIPFLRRVLPGVLLLVIGVLLIAVAIAIPEHLLSV